MPRLFYVSLLFGLLVACADETEPPDAAPADAGRPDALAPDAASPPDAGFADAGPPPDSGVRFAQSSCEPCESGCAGGLCLSTDQESFCGDACDADLDGCADGFTCFDISGGDGQYFCVPPAATCAPPGVRFGTSCYGDTTGCLPGTNHCEGDFHSLGYCTIRCLETAECPTGWVCRPGDSGYDVCAPDTLGAAELCARTPDPSEPPCAIDADCAGLPGALCVRSDPRLPGVCSLPCTAADDCGEGQICGDTPRGAVCLSARCDCHATPAIAATGRDLLGETLAQVERSRCTLGWTVHDWKATPQDVLHDPYRLSWFDRSHNEPLAGFDFAKGAAAELESQSNLRSPAPVRAARMVERLASLLDRPAVRRTPTPPDPSAPLTEAVVDLIVATGGAPDRAAIAAQAELLPMDLRRAVAQLVEAVRLGYEAQRAAVPSARDRERLFEFLPAFALQRPDRRGLDATAASVRNLLNRDFGYGELFGAGAGALEAIADSQIAQLLRAPTGTGTSTATLLFSVETPVGRIGIGDGESGVYDPRVPGMDGPWALLVDLGGDDEYRVAAGGTQSEDNPVSLLVDLGGDDVYGYVVSPAAGDEGRLPSDDGGRYAPAAGPDEDNGPISFSDVARQGAGRLGVGLLVDLGDGEDHYQSLRMSQGVGIGGVGVLLDEGGADVYLAEAGAQGAGLFGIGLLYDVDGDDVRRSYTMSQGFAYARGAGLLFDQAGDDQYLMDPGDPEVGGDPLYFSAQRPGRANSTLGQGFAFGRRADFTDRAFMSGGVGMLLDRRGADRYEGSIFAQGGGFWFGTGILADYEGADTYDGLWYAMGAGAHYAMGFFFEGAGNDLYGAALPRVNVTLGGGHDLTSVFFVDEAGDDTYLGSRITVGAGNLNGVGVFVDNAGDDTYETRSTYGIGGAGVLEADAPGSPRRKIDTFGLFVDAGGQDSYTLEDGTPVAGRGDDAAWVTSENEDPLVNRVELGSGVDGEGESTLHFP